MLYFFLPYGLITITILYLFINLSDMKSLGVIVITTLVFEVLGSLLFFIYITNTGVSSYCFIGKLLILPRNFSVDIIFIYDSITFTFHTILFFALTVCVAFLIQYFEYDFNGHSIIILSSIFSQLAFTYFCTYDLFSIILFWEWISIVSFFLIQHWNIRITTVKAAIKVFTISQLGDFFFLTSIFSIFVFFETTDLSVILANVMLYNNIYISTILQINALTIVSALLSFSLLLKAAQFIFFPWLLDAMEAPVPISSQLHSSTLVIIGFYVYYRFYQLISIKPAILYLYFLFSFFTVITATFLGFFQDDGKRLLACSTASQLGYVILAISFNLINESIYLLVFVCVNKAFTFVWFGVIMDKCGGVSDFRLMKKHVWSNFEKLGLLFSCMNSTIVAGSFNWHIKGLLSRGFLDHEYFYYVLSLEVLNLTWFLSTIYLYKLFSVIFIMTFRGLPIDLYVDREYINLFTEEYYSMWAYLALKSLFWLVSIIMVLSLTAYSTCWLALYVCRRMYLELNNGSNKLVIELITIFIYFYSLSVLILYAGIRLLIEFRLSKKNIFYVSFVFIFILLSAGIPPVSTFFIKLVFLNYVHSYYGLILSITLILLFVYFWYIASSVLIALIQNGIDLNLSSYKNLLLNISIIIAVIFILLNIFIVQECLLTIKI